VGDACVTRTEPAVERVLTAPPVLPLPAAGPVEVVPAPVTHAIPKTPEPLPVPIIIPLDSYADEPVVEYGWIEIPKIGLSHQLFEGVTLHNIDEGPSHWTGTAAPGRPGNAVFAGHRVTHSRPFRWIDQLDVGDSVIFTVGPVRSVYRVTDSLVVGPEDTWIANQTAEPTATLYACHPPGSAAQRYVVQMALVSSGPAPA
jgi:sortase A